MGYKLLVAVVFPLMLGWGLYDYPPVQIFWTQDNWTQVYDCYPLQDHVDPAVKVYLNTPYGVAIYGCDYQTGFGFQPFLLDKAEHA